MTSHEKRVCDGVDYGYSLLKEVMLVLWWSLVVSWRQLWSIEGCAGVRKGEVMAKGEGTRTTVEKGERKRVVEFSFLFF